MIDVVVSRHVRPPACRAFRSGSTLAGSRTPPTYKQAGNGVNVGAAYHVFREHVLAHIGSVAKRRPGLARSVIAAALSPDAYVEAFTGGGLSGTRTREGIEVVEGLAEYAG